MSAKRSEDAVPEARGGASERGSSGGSPDAGLPGAGLRGSLPEMPGDGPPLLAAVPEDGPSSLAASPQRSCALGVCDGSGWIVGDDEVATPCGCRKRRIERARVSGVAGALPKRYRGVSFDRPPLPAMAQARETRAAVADVRSFCEEVDERLDGGHGLWMTGGTGTGKTTLAMLVSKAAIEAGRTVAIYSMPRLLSRIRRTFDGEPGEDSYATFFGRLSGVDLLHIDDLGAENRTEWVLEQLYTIVDRRYEEQRSIVVTTNLDEGDLTDQLGERIVSRLTEMCGDPILFPEADDRRMFAVDEG